MIATLIALLAVVNSPVNNVTYACDGGTAVYTVNFPYLSSIDLVVTSTTPAGGVSTLVQGIDWTVNLSSTSSTAALTLNSPATKCPAGNTFRIVRTLQLTQPKSFRQQNNYDPAVHEQAYDRATMISQQLMALYTNPPATVLPANVTAKLNGIRFADQFANIQAAINDAGTTGSVLIPSGYTATDTFVNPNGIHILDMRGGASGASRVINVKSYGACGNGVCDDTAAIQSAINAALPATDPVTTTRTATRSVFIPAGTYNITASIRVVSAMGLYISGAGPQATVINVAANMPASSVFDLNGLSRSELANFAIGGSNSNTFDAGISLYWDQATAQRSTAYNIFRNISLDTGKFVDGFRIGNAAFPGVQVSEDQFYSCRVVGQWTAGEVTWWQSGFKLGDGAFGNNLDHAVYAPEVTNVRRGIYNAASNVSVYGGMIQWTETDLYGDNMHGYFNADGFRSENSQQLFFAGFASNPKNIEISNVQWNITGNTIASRHVVEFDGTGDIVLRNVQFNTGTGGTGIAPIMYLNTPNNIVAILDGVTIGGAGTLANFVQGSANTSVYVRGVIEMSNTNTPLVGWNAVHFGDIKFGAINVAAPATAPDTRIFRSAAGIVGLTSGLDLGATTFAGLGTPANGRVLYCSDCTIANPCAGGGTGAFAKRLNGVWVCN